MSLNSSGSPRENEPRRITPSIASMCAARLANVSITDHCRSDSARSRPGQSLMLTERKLSPGCSIVAFEQLATSAAKGEGQSKLHASQCPSPSG